ncbi:hypothetical protein L1077_21775 [Pseudoalteromonas luteoviolacea]|uniref:hypothetical protein n=1 Tax=Pseudoalteromonas luteoviolacea TaxID=43657 RepID=UPI001F22845D|nr:hypothetical protein [Pseudoalteromonas luteoviolacea]MCF6442062.1 hypothetical protein [Pseudoalteromonas luteoviolacea]
MYYAIGREAEWQGTKHEIIGMAPACKVGLGEGYAALLLVGNTSKYVNTSELKLAHQRGGSIE